MPERGPLVRFAKEINRVLDYVDSMKIVRGKAYRVRHTNHGQLIDFTPESAVVETTPAELQRFHIDAVNPEYLLCRKSDEDGLPIGTQTYEVAKPLSLRISTYDGLSVPAFGGTFSFAYTDSNERRVTNTTTGRYFDEELWPPYQVGDNELFAMRAIGKTNVDDGEGGKLDWVDLNADGKCFRPIMTEVAVCIGNVVRYMYVAGGPVQS